MNARVFAATACTLVFAGCVVADEHPPEDASVLAQNLDAMCGEYARLFLDPEGDEQITGTCYIRTDENLSIFNELAPSVYYGALIVEPVSGEIDVLDFHGLVAIQGNLRIGPSLDLVGINAQNLGNVSEQLVIQDNQALVDIAMPSLVGVGYLFDVVNNPLLPQCQVDALREQFAEAPQTDGVFTGNCDDCC